MLNRVVEAKEYEHKVSGAVYAQAMRVAAGQKDEAMFRRIEDGLTRRVHQVAPKASVAVALGGPFKEVFGGDAFAQGADVVFYLLSDEIDIDSKQVMSST
jgi:hypothetical protein